MAALRATASLGGIARLGAQLLADVYAGTAWARVTVLAPDDVLLIGAMQETLSPTEAFGVAASYLRFLVENGDYAESTIDKALGIIARFIKYAERRYELTDIAAVDQEHALAFVHAPILGKELKTAEGRTIDNRWWALDLFFRTLRGLNLYNEDPLLDAVRARRARSKFRPLLDAEVHRCRKHAPTRLDDTLNPARLALAEAMAATSEIPRVVIADYNPERGRLWLDGSNKRLLGRWTKLHPAGIQAIERRILALGATDLGHPLAYEGATAESGKPINPAYAETSTSTALRRILTRAGLTRTTDPHVIPSSIRAWGARRIYDETQDIEEVARALGIHNLNDARHAIGLEPREADPPPPHRRAR